MTSDWPSKPIGEIANVVGGGTPRTSNPENFGGGIPWLTPNDLKDHAGIYVSEGERSLTRAGIDSSSARLHPTGTVLLSSRAPIGYLAIAANPIATNQGFRSLILKDGYLPEYYYYVMLTKREEMEAVAGGSTFKEISGKTLKTIEVPTPPMEDQRAIAEVLGSIDRLVMANRNAAEVALGALVAMCQAEDESTQMPVAELGEFVNGGAYTKHANGFGRLVVRITELTQGIGPSSSWTDIDAPPEKTAYCGDILFSWSATLDVFRWVRQEAIVNQHIFKVIPREDLAEWLVFAKLREAMPTFQKVAADRATTMGHIKRGHLDEVSVQMPSRERLELIDSAAQSLWDIHLQLWEESLTAERLREQLLPELVTGRNRIENPERVIRRVTA